MGLLTSETLPEQTALDRHNPWSDDDLDVLTAGLLREQRLPDDDSSGLHGQRHEQQYEQLNEPAPWQRPAAYWIEVRLILLRALFSYEA